MNLHALAGHEQRQLLESFNPGYERKSLTCSRFSMFGILLWICLLSFFSEFVCASMDSNKYFKNSDSSSTSNRVSITRDEQLQRRQLQQDNTPSAVPLDTSSAPTYSEKCYVCGSEDSFVSTPDVNVTIIPGRTALCGSLERAGRTGLIPQAGCSLSTAAAAAFCNCQSNGTLPSTTTEIPASSPITTDTTLIPTIGGSPITTDTTLIPTIGGARSACYICGDENSFVSRPDSILVDLILPSDITNTCGVVERAGRELLLPASVCSVATRLAPTICFCNGTSLSTANPNTMKDSIAPAMTAVASTTSPTSTTTTSGTNFGTETGTASNMTKPSMQPVAAPAAVQAPLPTAIRAPLASPVSSPTTTSNSSTLVSLSCLVWTLMLVLAVVPIAI